MCTACETHHIVEQRHPIGMQSPRAAILIIDESFYGDAFFVVFFVLACAWWAYSSSSTVPSLSLSCVNDRLLLCQNHPV